MTPTVPFTSLASWIQDVLERTECENDHKHRPCHARTFPSYGQAPEWRALILANGNVETATRLHITADPATANICLGVMTSAGLDKYVEDAKASESAFHRYNMAPARIALNGIGTRLSAEDAMQVAQALIEAVAILSHKES